MLNRLALLASVAICLATAANGDTPDYTVTMQGDEAPKVMAWMQPASVSYTANAGKPDSYAVNVAGRLDKRVAKDSSDTYFLRLLVHKNNQIGQQLESYTGQIGYHAEFGGSDSTDPQFVKNAMFFPTDFSAGYSQTGFFPTGTPTFCAADPTSPTCISQRQRSVRFMATTQPFTSDWETTFSDQNGDPNKLDGAAWTHSFAPSLSLFSDTVVESVINPLTGLKSDGTVTGTKLVLGGALSPRWTDYRLVLRGSAQWMQAFTRADARASMFRDTTYLVTASLDYEFGHRTFESGAGWAPAIGVTYTNGQDPLIGQKYQNNFVIGFKLTYLSGSPS